MFGLLMVVCCLEKQQNLAVQKLKFVRWLWNIMAKLCVEKNISFARNHFVGIVFLMYFFFHFKFSFYFLSIVIRNGPFGNTGRPNINLDVVLKFTKRPKTLGITLKKHAFFLKGISYLQVILMLFGIK